MVGKVYLVGAGPGKADLLTLRARQAIDRADVILYDQLTGDIKETFPHAAELIDCGKYSERHTLEQADIEAIMIARAKEGKVVVRLKGGDPFLFGRGGEELAACREHGINVELVPGVTSAIAVPGCIGIPLTHRSYASQVAIVTGHEDPTKSRASIQWDVLAKFDGTIVILMGVKHLQAICSNLIKGGKNPKTPIAVIERGLEKHQRVLIGSIADIGGKAAEHKVRPPAVIVIGDVVGMYREGSICDRDY